MFTDLIKHGISSANCRRHDSGGPTNAPTRHIESGRAGLRAGEQQPFILTRLTIILTQDKAGTGTPELSVMFLKAKEAAHLAGRKYLPQYIASW